VTPRALRWLLLFAALLVSHRAWSQTAAYQLDSVVSPAPSAFLQGVVEVVARIDNPTAQAISGEVVLHGSDFGDADVQSRAAFSAAPGSNVLVRVPVIAKQRVRADILVGGRSQQTLDLNPTFEQAVRVFDGNQPSRLKASLESMSVSINPGLYGPKPGPGSGGPVARMRFSSTIADAQGQTILPSRPATWHGVHLVVLPCARLEALSGDEAEALAGFVMAGGTLALHVQKPEDLRGERLRALAGGDPREVEPGARMLATFQRPSGPITSDANPLIEVPELPREFPVVAYAGGNLSESAFGASAPYGLGELVLLGFDPSNAPAASHPWVRSRTVELARRAYERVTIAAIRPGAIKGSAYSRSMGGVSGNDRVRQLLDPNRTARWGIGLAALVICLYAVVAGPVAFTRAKNKNRPLAALLALPLLSLSTFLLIVVVGFIAKGTGQSARRLTLVEAGGGMHGAVARHYRAFFSPSAQELSVGASQRTGMLSLEMDDGASFGLRVDGDGLRLSDLEGTPGQTVVVREDAMYDLGDGIALIRGKAPPELTIVNRSGKSLRNLLVKLPNNAFYYLPKLESGGHIAAKDFASHGAIEVWSGHPTAPLGASPPAFDFYNFAGVLEAQQEAEAGEAWTAIAGAAPDDMAWFPEGVPVLLGELEANGPLGKDSGVAIKQARTLVRVVGFGGEAP
jgi:hypothetical protein